MISANLEALQLSSGNFAVTVLPEAGGRIYSIRHAGLGRELLWHNPLVPAAAVHGPAVYDDCWCGGWDDVLPNDEPASVNGLALPDHGELWSAAFAVLERAADRVLLRARCERAGIDVEKAIRIERDSILVRYTLTNLRDAELPFMWKLHPAVAVAPGDRIYIPARRFALEQASLGTLTDADMSGAWPFVDGPHRRVDLRCVLPREAGELFFAYGLDLAEGACGVFRPSERSLCLWTFPKDLFKGCMLFACYGGWRGHYVAVLEPTTAWPFRLEEAIAAGTCSRLAAGARTEAEVRFQVRSGVDWPTSDA